MKSRDDRDKELDVEIVAVDAITLIVLGVAAVVGLVTVGILALVSAV